MGFINKNLKGILPALKPQIKEFTHIFGALENLTNPRTLGEAFSPPQT
jgi:hypothetical protein